MISDLQALLVEAMLVLTGALLLVLALRRPLRRWLGARVAYGAWCLPPVALAAYALPAPQAAIEVHWLSSVASVGPLTVDAIADVSVANQPGWLVLLWIAGALATAGNLMIRQRKFISALQPLLPHGERSYLSAGAAGPLLVGHWRPYIVLPLDFAQRYTAEQQALMLAHEHAHLRAGDALANALAALIASFAWFNPVVWWALRMFHFDQELACDARVLEYQPQARRTYADAMLQTQLAEQRMRAPLGCQWPNGHPLKERIQMLSLALPDRARRRRGSLMIVLVSLLLSCAVWAAQPARVVAADAEARLYSVRILLTQPGQAPQMPSLIVREGELAGIRSDDVEINLKVSADTGTDVRVSSDVRVAGWAAGSPSIVVKAGTPGTISMDTDAQRSVTVTYWVSEHRGNPASGVEPHDRMADIRTPPRYPKQAMLDGIEGEVVLEFEVDASGVVRDVAVVSATPPKTFDEAAIAAARGWWLNPENQPPGTLPRRMRAPVKFELDRETPPAG
jgi:TonB family protein